MRSIIVLVLCLTGAASAIGRVLPAQDRQEEPAPTSVPVRTGSVPLSSVGEVGQRQTRDEARPDVTPTGRLSNRIQNRVQSRIRNRIDRNYDPQANAVAPFATAEDQARISPR